MKKLIALLLIVSGVAQGQITEKIIPHFTGEVVMPGTCTLEARTPTADFRDGVLFNWSDVTIRPNTILPKTNYKMQNKEGDVRVLKTPKRTPQKVVIVTDDGTLKMIDAFIVTTSEILTEVMRNPNITTKHGPGSYSTTAAAYWYDYEWKDHIHHYEDADGNILTEAYQLIKL